MFACFTQVLAEHLAAPASLAPPVQEVFEFLGEICLELAVVFVCLTLLASRQLLGRQRVVEKALKPRRVAPDVVQGRAAPRKAVAAPDGPPPHKRAQRLVAALVEASSDPLPLYEELVASHGRQLRELIKDDQAVSVYVALVAYSVRTAKPQGVELHLQRALQDMRRFGFPRTITFYGHVMKLLANGQQFASVVRLHDSMVADHVAPDKSMYVCIINAALASGLPDLALELFSSLEKAGAPSVRTYMSILQVHAKRNDWASATRLLAGMKAAGTEPDNLMLNRVMGLCVTAYQVAAAETVAETWRPLMDVVSCNILLKGFSQQAELLRADALLKQMAAEGPEPNLISYNTVMDCAVRAMQSLSSPAERRKARSTGKGTSDDRDNTPDGLHARGSPSFRAVAQRPWQLLDQIHARGLEPDRYTCSTLVKGMHLAGCSVVEIDRVTALLKLLGAHALQDRPDAPQGNQDQGNTRLLEVLFNTLLDACVTSRDLDRMAEIFGLMRSFKAGVSAVTFGTLIKAFGHAKRLGRCSEVWEEMRRAGVRPTAVTYGCYIDACMRNESLDQALDVYADMDADGVAPNAVIFTLLIRGLARAREPARALAFYREMRVRGIEPTAVTFNSVLDIIARQLSEPDKLAEVIADMKAADVAPDVVTYSILIKASCSAGQLDSALALFEQLRQNGLLYDQVTFNTLLLACSKAGRLAEAERIFASMCELGMRPTNVTISILVKMYGRSKMLGKAISTVETMERDYGETPNLFVYTCLIQACAQNSQVKRSWDIFNEMLRNGIEPDAITYGTMIHGCVYLSKFDEAMCLVRQAYALPSPPSVEDAPFCFGRTQRSVVVPLQAEVLATLLGALRRKRQAPAARELEDIMAEHGVTAPALD